MRRVAMVVLLGALVASCAADPEPAAPAPTTTAAVVTTTTLSAAEREERAAAAAETKRLMKEMNRTLSSQLRPSWCGYYFTWKRAVDEQDNIAARHGSNVTAWPERVRKQWEAALDAQLEAADVLWGLTEDGIAPRGWDATARACR